MKKITIIFIGLLLLLSVGGISADTSGHELISTFGSNESLGASATCNCNVNWNWQAVASLPEPRDAGGAIAAGGFIYYIGGHATNGGATVSSNKVFRYIPFLNMWQEMAPLPEACSDFGIALYNGRIYVIGGQRWEGSEYVWKKSVFSYSIFTDTWRIEQSLPEYRLRPSAVVINGELVVIGGEEQDSTTDAIAVTDYRFAPYASQKWVPFDSGLPTRRSAMAAVSLNNKHYFVGGMTGYYQTPYGMTLTEHYDAENNAWTKGADMQLHRAMVDGGAINGCVVVVGGWNPYGSAAFDRAELYNPQTDLWISLPDMPTGRFDAKTVVLNNKLYVIGGWRDSVTYPMSLSTVERLAAN